MEVKHPTVGIMITPSDKDIAAWFNMMRGHNPSKWIAGMLAAWEMGETLSAGVVCIPKATPTPPTPMGKVPLFGTGTAQVQNTAPKYGWTVKGRNGEYVVGSVINVSIARQELAPIITKLKASRTQLAPFIKALIRAGITVGDENQMPEDSALNNVFCKYRLRRPATLIEMPMFDNNKRTGESAPPKFAPIRHS